MKNRDFKEFGPGTIVHIYNRGNNKEKIFFDEQDYRAFLFRLGLSLGFDEKEIQKDNLLSLPYSRIRITDTNKSDYKLHAFCLMPNHFHLLVEQTNNTSISKMLSKVCTSYAMFVNKKHKRVGHVFQDQFKAVQIEDDAQLMWASAYIHMNPVKDGLVKHPGQYKWSSFKDYSEERGLQIVTTDLLLGIFGDKNSLVGETENYLKETSMSRMPLDI
ncbi:MAG: hypothetical protein A2566_01585 [Candidatus Zambryskibacteria bacterium RIFOXYD1_FULL_40_13]|nr:MAG: Transposase IS200-family protein [Parcubacteria group bacterium GW2011_GWC1_39_12]KKR19542.1 MAG: Transposase IS200-family protein [Parcubacteria group bacterium GW2011_GWF1_39_37]KKR35695.1 MAG: Transposase IS200-family protein [Parcubacteria group bacterium GW2011_GWC2_40_10]KKR52510.1 MAG: Transposase IS200-family protein [Parcubacteria group bacterium GW2011_GWE1_40_20]KKR65415.1 MAG: Transposase IS200-family protein [Parcubacteria group bacterium GW2011_GWB1_40_5]KKR68958.1 MAG: T